MVQLRGAELAAAVQVGRACGLKDVNKTVIEGAGRRGQARVPGAGLRPSPVPVPF